MQHVLQDLARDRHQSMLTMGESQRQGERASRHSRICRRAERAERRLVSRWDEATQLRAHLTELESTS